MSQLWMGDILPKLARSDRLRAFSVGLGLLLLGVLCTLSYVNLQYEIGAHRVIRGAQDVINELGNLSNAIDDAESAQRGYLLTGDKSFLQTYNETVDDVATASSRLRSLWADDAPQTARLKEFEGLLQERLRLLSANLTYRTASGLAISDPSRLLLGQKLMEEIDQSIFAMLESERQQVTRTTEEVASRDRALADLLLAGVVLSLGFIGPSYLLVNREAKRRRTAEALLRTANADLENRIATRTAQLHRSEGQLRLFIDGAPAAIAMFDREMRYLATSRRFVEDYRLNGQDLTGRSHYDVFPEISMRWRDVHRRCLAGAVESSEEESFPRADGQVDWIKWEIRPWYEEQGAIGGIILFSENVTERKQAEEHRRRLEEQLRQTQKIEAVGQLTGGIAHDFNNLLGVVIGNLDHVLERVDGETETGKMINLALNGALHGAELTHRLLAFARQQQLEPKGFSINEMLPDITAVLKRTLGETIAIRISPDENLWPAFADPSQVQDAILNLAINARDAMPEGGTLTIETANIEFDEAYCKDNPEAKPGDYAMLAISDTGVGMSSEVVARAFEPFFTTKPMGQGTGLGLSMIYGFARQSGGHLKLYSEVGLGTSVKLYLPRANDDKVSKSVATKEQASPRGSEVILVAEDNADLRQMAVAQLSGLGYHVLEVQNGEEALAVLMGEAQIDLLFSDIIMSGKLTGHGLARQARKYRPDLKVLLTTGYAEKAATAGHGDGEHVLRKPYRKREMAVKIRTILDLS